MSELAPIFLAIHILTAIVAFGPSFWFSLISGFAAKEPQHGLFAIRLIDLIERRLILPAALTMPVSGALLIWSEGIDLLGAHWLLTEIALYVVAIAFAFFVQLRTIDRMIEVTGRMAAGAAAAGVAHGASPAGGQIAAGRPAMQAVFAAMPAGPDAQLAGTPDGGPAPGGPERPRWPD
jgi:uncharacterized membrane protein